LLEQPGEDALDNGPMLAQAASVFGVPSRDSGDDPSLPERFADLVLGIVGPVCVQRVGPASPATPRPLDGGNGIDQGHGGLGIMNIRAGMDQRKRDALAVADDMPFRPVFAAIRGIGASLRPPKRARTELLSTTALDQSILSANPNSSRSAFQTFCKTPATCQSRRRRQQVMPLPQPNSGGNSSHAVPVLATNRIPVRARRSGTRGRPPLGFRFTGGRRGLIHFHSSSVNRGLAISGPP
jgi:hypothetical protein